MICEVVHVTHSTFLEFDKNVLFCFLLLLFLIMLPKVDKYLFFLLFKINKCEQLKYNYLQLQFFLSRDYLIFI